MNGPSSASSDKEDANVALSRWTSISIGVAAFIGIAISDPVFDNLLLDIPLYLAVGLADVALFWLTVFLTAIAIGREKMMRDDRVSAVGWSIVAFAFVVAVSVLGGVMIVLWGL